MATAFRRQRDIPCRYGWLRLWRSDQLFWVDHLVLPYCLRPRRASHRCASSDMLLSAFTFISRNPSERATSTTPTVSRTNQSGHCYEDKERRMSDALLFFSFPRCRGAGQGWILCTRISSPSLRQTIAMRLTWPAYKENDLSNTCELFITRHDAHFLPANTYFSRPNRPSSSTAHSDQPPVPIINFVLPTSARGPSGNHVLSPEGRQRLAADPLSTILISNCCPLYLAGQDHGNLLVICSSLISRRTRTCAMSSALASAITYSL